ncbi:hypothetical protein PTI98_008476 [Pleurotus ostreatus]|nr:hypothetical protein PTI98_008476 [Pleurotus ostreatus]
MRLQPSPPCAGTSRIYRIAASIARQPEVPNHAGDAILFLRPLLELELVDDGEKRVVRARLEGPHDIHQEIIELGEMEGDEAHRLGGFGRGGVEGDGMDGGDERDELDFGGLQNVEVEGVCKVDIVRFVCGFCAHRWMVLSLGSRW